MTTPHLTKLSELAREGERLGLELERGQAATPLADHFASLLDEVSLRPRGVTLVSTQTGAETEALAWLLGEDHRGVSLRLGALAQLSEIHVADHGYALLGPDQERVELDGLPALLCALDASAARRTVPARDGRLAICLPLSTAAGTQGLSLLLPASLTATADVPGLAGELIARSELLAVAHPTDATAPDPDAIGRLQHLAQGIGCVLPLFVGPATPTGPAPAALKRWWKTIAQSGVLLLAPLRQSGGVTSQALTSGPYGELLGLLAAAAAARRLQLAAEALRERHDMDLRQLQARRQREEANLRTDGGSDLALRRPFELARTSLQDEIAALGKAVTDSSRRSLLPDGTVGRALEEQLRALRRDDIAQEVASKTLRLTLSNEYQSHLERTLRKALKDDLRHDLLVLRNGLEALRATLEKQLETSNGQPVTLALPPPSESDLWARIGELVNLTIRYRAEMPRRGFLQRLGEGRRAVFGAMMILSLVGSMVGFSWRGLGILGFAFLLMFIGVVVYTYMSWKREDTERLDSELERIRDQLSTEVKRMAGDALREKQARITDDLEQVKRAVGQRIDDLSRERQQRDLQTLSDQRDRARQRVGKLEQQLREGQALAPRLARLQQDAQALLTEAERAARDMAQRLNLLA